MAKKLIGVFQGRNLDVLIQEGTHFGFADGDRKTEYELEDEIVEAISQAKGLVLASLSPQHVDRLVGFIRAAKKTGRIFICDTYTAFICYLVASQTTVPVPGRDNDLRVYFPELFIQSAKRRGILSKFEGLFGESRIGIEEITANPAKHLMVFRPSMLGDFNDVLPPETVCLYSRWAGYLGNEDWKRTEKILARNSPGGAPLKILHVSGHILSQHVVRLVEALGPKLIVPIHTFCPEEFGRRFDNVYLPQDGEAVHVC